MTTPCAAAEPSEPSPRADGRGLVFWYQATRLARASASCRYRLGHFAERLVGATCVVDPKPPLGLLASGSVLVVVRPFLEQAHRDLLFRCRQRGVTLIADFDDLLFGGEPDDHPLVLSGALSRQECGRRIEIYRASLELFDAFTVATEPLREALHALDPAARVVVTPNGLSRSWIAQGRLLYRAWRPGDTKVIRFLAGSPSHDADLAEVSPILGEVLRAHPEVSLELVGPGAWDQAGLPKAQVRCLPHLPFAELPRLIARSWVCIAPLRPSAFTRCKSAIKFLEAAALGAPCIASPNPDALRHRSGGILLAGQEGERTNERAWWEALTRLLDDTERMSVGLRARQYVEHHGLADEGARILSRELLGRAT
jgi:glycosyltransferase involved in cell wall biosynthesis